MLPKTFKSKRFLRGVSKPKTLKQPLRRWFLKDLRPSDSKTNFRPPKAGFRLTRFVWTEPSPSRFVFHQQHAQHGSSSRIISSGCLNLENIDFPQQHPINFRGIQIQSLNFIISWSLLKALGLVWERMIQKGFLISIRNPTSIHPLHPEGWVVVILIPSPPKQKPSTNPLEKAGFNMVQPWLDRDTWTKEFGSA